MNKHTDKCRFWDDGEFCDCGLFVEQDLRAQLSALTEELREERAKPERYRDAENRHLRSKLSIITEERDRYREALEGLADAPVLCFDNTSGWVQSCQECEKKKAAARSALSLSPLPEREKKG